MTPGARRATDTGRAPTARPSGPRPLRITVRPATNAAPAPFAGTAPARPTQGRDRPTILRAGHISFLSPHFPVASDPGAATGPFPRLLPPRAGVIFCKAPPF